MHPSTGLCTRQCPANPVLLPAQPVSGTLPPREPPFDTTKQQPCLWPGETLTKEVWDRQGWRRSGPMTSVAVAAAWGGEARKMMDFFRGLLVSAPGPTGGVLGNTAPLCSVLADPTGAGLLYGGVFLWKPSKGIFCCSFC